MRVIFIFITTIFYLNNSFSQDTVERKDRLTDSVIERFYVLRSDPAIKQGPYHAIFRRKTFVAIGNYHNNKKTGVWQFFNTRGKLVEKYNYNSKRITLEAPLSAEDDLTFLFDAHMDTTDKLTRPLKIGGSYYGFIPYVNAFQVPFDTFDTNTNSFMVYIELLISPLGRLADYKVHLKSLIYNYNQSFNLDVNLFSEEDRTFIPATLNGEPILSRIIIKCFVKDDGRLDFY